MRVLDRCAAPWLRLFGSLAGGIALWALVIAAFLWLLFRN